jgi:glutamate dehydrogenase (NAD(P)+)
MAWVMDTYSMHVGHTETAVVTGKPIEMGGSLGRREATGRGVMIVTREAAKHLEFDIKGATVAVQGFGNVGSVSADLLARIGAKIVAVTDWKGGVYNANGLDIAKLLAHTAQHKTVAGFPDADTLDGDAIWGLAVDILIPAALENQITMENAPHIKARVVTEGANGPTTPEAHAHLHTRGVFVIPDILANAGGVTVSYFEWVQGLQNFFWTQKEVQDELQKIMEKSFDEVNAKADSADCDYRSAAYTIAISRVAEACRLKGLFP